MSQVIINCSTLKEVLRGRRNEVKGHLVLVRQFDILLKEVCEMASWCWELDRQSGNVHRQRGLDTLCCANTCHCNPCLGQSGFVTGPAVFSLLVPAPEQQMTSVSRRGDLSGCFHLDL